MFEEIKIWLTAFLSDGMGKLLTALVILAAGIVVVRIVMTVLRKFLEASKLEKAAHTLIKSLVRVVLYLLLGLMVVDSLGIDVTGVIALASVLTLSVSLALQNALANVFGGFTLLYTAPFHSGDFVDIGADSGTVVEIGMTYTKLQTPDNKMISIPNSTVVAGDIVNYSITGTRRVDVAISASYDVPAAKAEQVLMEAAQAPGILVDPAPFVSVTGYGDSAIQYVVRVWTKTESYWDVHFAITHAIKEKFDSNDVQMTYPHLNIHIDK